MSSIAIPVEITEATWCSPDGKFSGRYNPSGKFGFAYDDPKIVRSNPEWWSDTEPLYASRIFVGFNVGDRPTWTMEDLVRLVKSVRLRQVGKADHTILYQKGVYTSKKSGKQKPITEEGGQIIILNLKEFMKPKDRKKAKEVFRAQMVSLADRIIEEMHQEMVIVEIQKDGIRVETVGVLSKEAIEKEKQKSVSQIEIE
jgi:hypothetical protein